MKVVSVNIAERQLIKWRGKDVETGIFKYPVHEPIYLGFTDVKKDNVVDRIYHGGLDKACYMYSVDCYSYWKEKFPDLEWQLGMFGENITVDGLDESNLNIGDVFQIGNAKVQVAQPRQPCFKLGVRFKSQTILKQFINAPYPGVYLRVLEEGEVKEDDDMLLIESGKSKLNLLRVFELMYHGKSTDSIEIEAILTEGIIPDECKDALRKRL